MNVVIISSGVRTWTSAAVKTTTKAAAGTTLVVGVGTVRVIVVIVMVGVGTIRVIVVIVVGIMRVIVVIVMVVIVVIIIMVVNRVDSATVNSEQSRRNEENGAVTEDCREDGLVLIRAELQTAMDSTLSRPVLFPKAQKRREETGG